MLKTNSFAWRAQFLGTADTFRARWREGHIVSNINAADSFVGVHDRYWPEADVQKSRLTSASGGRKDFSILDRHFHFWPITEVELIDTSITKKLSSFFWQSRAPHAIERGPAAPACIPSTNWELRSSAIARSAWLSTLSSPTHLILAVR
jgi:hypothetical protein